jgi:hypothetical protein
MKKVSLILIKVVGGIALAIFVFWVLGVFIIFDYLFAREKDFVKKGYSQEQLREKVPSWVGSNLPEDAMVWYALATGGRDSTMWSVVSCPTPMTDIIITLEKQGFAKSSFTTSTPPRPLPASLKPYIDLVEFNTATSLMRSRHSDPSMSGVWVIFSRHKKVYLVCRYSS